MALVDSSVSTPPAAPAPSAAEPCPRCKKPLIDPTGLGWCRACGYCRSLENIDLLAQPGAAAPPPAAATASAPKAPASDAGVRIPAWTLILAVSVVGLAAGSYLVGKHMTFKPLDRALWTTIQIAAGLVLMLFGQLIALIRIAPDEATLGFKDVFLPFRLYGLILKRLSDSRLPLVLILWGLTLVLGAAGFIRGLDYWQQYLPGGEKASSTTRR